MKKLIVILFPFVAFSQTKEIAFRTLDSVEIYFLQELNAYRKQTYAKIPDIIKSDVISKASLHHTRYLINMHSADGMRRIFGHDEIATFDNNDVFYHGSDTLLLEPGDRINFYDTTNYVAQYSEICQYFPAYARTFEVLSQQEIARRILQNFINSPDHKSILDLYQSTHIGISIIQPTEGRSLSIIICVNLCTISDSKYFIPNKVLPKYGNKLEDIQ
jgi:hypothetical protein